MSMKAVNRFYGLEAIPANTVYSTFTDKNPGQSKNYFLYHRAFLAYNYFLENEMNGRSHTTINFLGRRN